MRTRFQVLATVAMMSLLIGLVPSAHVRAIIIDTTTTISAGYLIRGTSSSAVYYYGEDGFRYVFPNEKTYFTWYENFDDVVTLTDELLASLQIGGNVTYKPGSRLVKINSDPKTYQVAPGGALRWVTSEALAVAMYGSTWNTQIDDVPDGFFGNYTIGSPIESINDLDEEICFDAHEPCTYTISDDMGLTAMTFMNIVDMEYKNPVDSSTTVTINAGETVWFANLDAVNHTFTADDNSWGTGTLEPWQSFVRRFDEPGMYTFHCSYHPEMTGTVIVE